MVKLSSVDSKLPPKLFTLSSNLGHLRKRKRDSEESCDKKILIDNEDQDTKSTFYVETKHD